MDRICIDSGVRNDNSSDSGTNKSIETIGDAVSNFTNDLSKQNAMKIC